MLTASLIVLVLSCSGGTSDGASTDSCAAGEVGAHPNCASSPPALAAPGKTWQVAFAEEFDGSDYDHAKLTPCFDWNYGDCTSSFNEGRETYKPEQVRVSGGTAKLVAEPLSPPEADSACFQGSCTYKAGLLSTARPNVGAQYLFPFTYGYVESRMKVPDVPGFFTAFWMLPTDPSYVYRSEIDIAEVLGGFPDSVFMTYAYDGRTQSYRVNDGLHDNGACAARDYSRDWVRFGVDWQPDHIAWYIDGVKCGQFDDAAKIENGPMQIILHMMVDNDWERREGSVLADQTVADQLEVDYIRVYQQH
ncbi:glycoside hydrolase family 16 protein [Rhodococcus maanshanensis]|uniref:glycoside hydrolase family 16 protein n=1 Tax=Rhodococcus maanshanensis TaxID=183556 RepID=UPI00093210A3|nr:glycoside hydrolase family 16 protein [Rhodococcus maanshanensis]